MNKSYTTDLSPVKQKPCSNLSLPPNASNPSISSADWLMATLALDHVRDYIHIGARSRWSAEPGPPLHRRFISPDGSPISGAPIFVFLSGTSVYLQSLRKSKKELGYFFIEKRTGWSLLNQPSSLLPGVFNTNFNIIPFQAAILGHWDQYVYPWSAGIGQNSLPHHFDPGYTHRCGT